MVKECRTVADQGTVYWTRSGEDVVRYPGDNNQQLPEQATLRDHAQVTRFFAGLDLVDPGVVQLHRWRPDRHQTDLDVEIPAWAGVGRKP